MEPDDFITMPVSSLESVIGLAVCAAVGIIKYGADLGIPSEEVGFTAEDNEQALAIIAMIMRYVDDRLFAVLEN